MKIILVPQKAKITPKCVLDEIKKFDYVNKSPYSSSCYNAPGITWEYKPEGSLRVSDHWNFISHNEKHCILAHTDKKVDNYWMLAKYIKGKYFVLKEFGENVDGYRFLSITENDTKMLKYLYNIGGIITSKEWYKQFNNRCVFVKETHVKNRKILSKALSKEKLKIFLEKNKDAKRIVFIEDEFIDMVNILLCLYEKSNKLQELAETTIGVGYLISKYNAYEFIDYKKESFNKVYTIVLKNNLAIDFKSEDMDKFKLSEI